jgi:hypothetical protein
VIVATFLLATTVALGMAARARLDLRAVALERDVAQHDLAVATAELGACRDTRRSLAAQLDDERRLQRLGATRGAP